MYTNEVMTQREAELTAQRSEDSSPGQDHSYTGQIATLTQQLATLQARVRELEVDNAKAHQIICDAYPLVKITPQDIAWAHERLAPPTEAQP